MRSGVAAEYGSVDALVAAIRAVRARGVTRVEAYSSVPSDKIDAALGAPRSPLAIAAGIGGLAGAAGGYFLQWLLVAYLYPVDVGSRPPHMPLPFTIITIEMGFLLGALSVFVAFLIGAKLLKLWEPLFDVPGFESVTRAGFWVAIDARDPAWDRAAIVDVLRDAGASRVYGFGGIG